jgi:hypothetical protein
LPLYWNTSPPFPSLPTPEFRREPKLAVAANGNAVVVWRQGPTSGGFDLMASFFTPAGGWSAPEFVWQKHPDAPSGAESVTVRMDAANNTLVVFQAVGLVRYNRHTPGSGWVNPQNGTGGLVSVIDQFADEPEMALNAAGQAVAIWKKAINVVPITRYDVWASTYSMTTNTWSAPGAIENDDTGGIFSRKSVVIDTAGTATALWSQYDGSRLHIMMNRRTGGSWGTPVAIEQGNTGVNGGVIDVRAVVDGAGNVMAMWLQLDTTQGHYVANRYVPGTGWGTQQNIGPYAATGSPASDTQFELSGNAAGHVVAVWSFTSGVGAENVIFPYDIYANEYNPVNGNWGAPDVIDGEDVDGGEEFETGEATSPQVAVDASGNAIAVWDTDGSDGYDGIREARFQ